MLQSCTCTHRYWLCHVATELHMHTQMLTMPYCLPFVLGRALQHFLLINVLLISILEDDYTWSFYILGATHTHHTPHTHLHYTIVVGYCEVAFQPRERKIWNQFQNQEEILFVRVFLWPRLFKLQCQSNIFAFSSAFFISREYFSSSIVKPLFFNLCIKFSVALHSSSLSWKASWKRTFF